MTTVAASSVVERFRTGNETVVATSGGVGRIRRRRWRSANVWILLCASSALRGCRAGKGKSTPLPTPGPSLLPTPPPPTDFPAASSSSSPSTSPTVEPSCEPSPLPSDAPTEEPSGRPSPSPSSVPSPLLSTSRPSTSPTTDAPTRTPSEEVVSPSSARPSPGPSHSSSATTTAIASAAPSILPSRRVAPSSGPSSTAPTTSSPSRPPTRTNVFGSSEPTTDPTTEPTSTSTLHPSVAPSSVPSDPVGFAEVRLPKLKVAVTFASALASDDVPRVRSVVLSKTTERLDDAFRRRFENDADHDFYGVRLVALDDDGRRLERRRRVATSFVDVVVDGTASFRGDDSVPSEADAREVLEEIVAEEQGGRGPLADAIRNSNNSVETVVVSIISDDDDGGAKGPPSGTTPPAATTPTDEGGGSGLSGASLGMTLGLSAFCAIGIAATILLFWRRRKRHRSTNKRPPATMDDWAERSILQMMSSGEESRPAVVAARHAREDLSCAGLSLEESMNTGMQGDVDFDASRGADRAGEEGESSQYSTGGGGGGVDDEARAGRSQLAMPRPYDVKRLDRIVRMSNVVVSRNACALMYGGGSEDTADDAGSLSSLSTNATTTTSVLGGGEPPPEAIEL